MTKIRNPNKAKKWLKNNWGKLVSEGRLGEALRRYYKLVGKTAGEAWEEIKEAVPDGR